MSKAKAKILVCGGRDYTDRNHVYSTLQQTVDELGFLDHAYDMPVNVELIAGGAKGADQHAVDWAIVNWVPFTEVLPDWDRHGKAAGHIRNGQMLKLCPDLVVAFPGGKGTANMIKQAERAGIEVRKIESKDKT